EAENNEQIFNEQVEKYQQKMAEKEPPIKKNNSITSKILRTVAYFSLVVTLVLAINTLIGSGDEQIYLTNRETFYFYGFICTVVYFTTAYWAMKRGKTTYDL